METIPQEKLDFRAILAEQMAQYEAAGGLVTQLPPCTYAEQVRCKKIHSGTRGARYSIATEVDGELVALTLKEHNKKQSQAFRLGQKGFVKSELNAK